MKFSVLMSVYKNENPIYFRRAMDSVLQQTLQPSEIVLVRDGVVPDELQSVIDEYVEQYPMIKYCPLEENVGLGNALNIGLRQTTYEIVARMDTDDICIPERFEKQIRFLKDNPDIAVVGGQIVEFYDEESNITAKREVPLSDKQIKTFLKKRNPFNHMTVTFRKDSVLAINGYEELHFLEDYYLWCRLSQIGVSFANLNEVLVFVRTNEEMYRRRGGWAYFQSFRRLEKYKKSVGLINVFEYWKMMSIRFLQAVLPNRIRQWVYMRFERKRVR